MCCKYSLYTIFRVFKFRSRTGLQKLFNNENFPIYGILPMPCHDRPIWNFEIVLGLRIRLCDVTIESFEVESQSQTPSLLACGTMHALHWRPFTTCSYHYAATGDMVIVSYTSTVLCSYRAMAQSSSASTGYNRNSTSFADTETIVSDCGWILMNLGSWSYIWKLHKGSVSVFSYVTFAILYVHI
jgi:hypothetical protein